MHYLMRFLTVSVVILLMGCSGVTHSDIEKRKIVYPMAGTNTAVVGISIDKHGVPEVLHKAIVVSPGQKVLFAGPDEFSIIFKNKKSPVRRIENQSMNGVVVIKVPDEILKQPEFAEEFRKNGQLKFSYGIRANGKELDPDFIVKK